MENNTAPKTALSELLTINQKLREEKEECSVKIAYLEQKLNKITTKNEQNAVTEFTFHNENIILKSSLEEAETENEEIKRKLHDTQELLSESENCLFKTKEELSTFQRKYINLQRNQVDVLDLQSQLNGIVQDYQRQKDHSREIATLLKNTENEVENLHFLSSELTSKNEENEAKISTLNMVNISLKSSLEKAENENKKIEEKLQEKHKLLESIRIEKDEKYDALFKKHEKLIIENLANKAVFEKTNRDSCSTIKDLKFEIGQLKLEVQKKNETA